VLLARAPQSGLSRLDPRPDAVFAGDPTRTLNDDEELMERGWMTPETSTDAEGEERPTSIAAEPNAAKVLCRDTAESVDRVTGSVGDLDDPHGSIIKLRMPPTAGSGR
jgi:hypothetical protein